MYITHPFNQKKISNGHQNQWQAVEMARIIGTFGYDVDAVNYAYDYLNSLKAKIRYKYDIIIDIIPRKNFWTELMKEGCINISYMTGMSVDYAYTAEHQRLHELELRRGIKLQARRTKNVNTASEKNIEDYNFVWFIGNSYNLHSFTDRYKMPPVCYIRNNGYNFSWAGTNTAIHKHNFIFFASSGQVHKGLDLLLEIFGREGFPCNLYICSSFRNEEDFCSAYHEELYNRPNIFPIGFIDIKGDQFRDIAGKCAYAVMPSCSEASAGSVLTIMSAGVIPIVSRECGFEDDEVISLPDCRLETIERYINEYAHKPDEWVRERSLKCIETVRTRYSKENFTKSVHDAMSVALKGARNVFTELT